jgi:hypothetical protein
MNLGNRPILPLNKNTLKLLGKDFKMKAPKGKGEIKPITKGHKGGATSKKRSRFVDWETINDR